MAEHEIGDILGRNMDELRWIFVKGLYIIKKNKDVCIIVEDCKWACEREQQLHY